MMKTIQKYILGEILNVFFKILCGIALFILVSNLLDQLPTIMQNKPPLILVIWYFACGMPFLFAESMPFAVLLSILYVFSQLNRNNELLAIRTAGIDFYSISVPVLALSLVISAGAIIANETIVSSSYDKAKYIKETLIEKRTSGLKEVRYDLAKLGTGGRIFYIQKFDGTLGTMNGVCMLKVDRDFNLLERVDAREGVWLKDKWLLKDGAIRAFDGIKEKSVTQFATYDLFTADTPGDFIVPRRSTEDTLAVNAFRLLKFIKLLKDSGFQYQEEATNFHLKFAFPFASFILALLGVSIPFMFNAQKSIVNAALGFVTTVISAFFYMGFVTIGISIGKVGLLPPIAAAWLGNILFLIIGLGVLVKVRK
jgi:lipopolysaccharide export system permease protein